jgi:hypothetical protein
MDEIAQAERPYDKALLAQVEQDLVVFFSTLRRLRVSLSRNFSEFKHYNHHLDPRLQPNRQFMRQCIAERRQNGDWDNYRILNTVYAVEFPDEFHHAFERDKDGHVLSVPGAWVRMKKAAKDQLGWQVEDIDREYEEAILNPVTQPDSLEDLKVGPKMPWLIKINGKAYTNKQIFSAMSPKREKKDRRRDKQLTFGGDLHPTASHIKTGRQPKLTPANTPNGETPTIPDDLNDSLQDLLTM